MGLLRHLVCLIITILIQFFYPLDVSCWLNHLPFHESPVGPKPLKSEEFLSDLTEDPYSSSRQKGLPEKRYADFPFQYVVPEKELTMIERTDNWIRATFFGDMPSECVVPGKEITVFEQIYNFMKAMFFGDFLCECVVPEKELTMFEKTYNWMTETFSVDIPPRWILRKQLSDILKSVTEIMEPPVLLWTGYCVVNNLYEKFTQ